MSNAPPDAPTFHMQTVLATMDRQRAESNAYVDASMRLAVRRLARDEANDRLWVRLRPYAAVGLVISGGLASFAYLVAFGMVNARSFEMIGASAVVVFTLIISVVVFLRRF